MATGPIQHIVVLMLENRSFDNVLGGLYGPNNAPPYQQPPPGQSGLAGIPSGISNPGPGGQLFYAYNQTTPTATGPAGPTYPPTTIPLIDPGEYFSDMAQQLIGLDTLPMSPPWGGYSPAGPSSAQGYVKNYSQIGPQPFDPIFKAQTPPPPANYGDVMNYFTPAQLPVSAFLANSYALSDTWFSSVPSQTYVNRSFALSAAPAVYQSYSLIDDYQYFSIPGPTDEGNPPRLPIEHRPTIFQQLDEALAGATGPFWKVYFHDYSITYDTLQYVRVKSAAQPNVNVGTFDDSDWQGQTPRQLPGPAASSFVDDLNNLALPPFSWIEPRYFDNWAPTGLPPNSNHPGTGGKPLVTPPSNAPIDAATGEVLLMQLYNLLRGSPLWNSTLLIVTYDENCGIWDQVAPPLATPPGATIPTANSTWDPAADTFNYDVFGGRVPAIFASPLVPPGSLIRPPAAGPPFDHTSILSTVREVLLGATGPALTARDAAAPSLVPGLAASPVNGTGAFAGTIVAGPSSLYFSPSGPGTQAVFASAGPEYPLSASAAPPLAVGVTGTTTITITVTADPAGLTGPYSGHVSIFSTGLTAAANSGLRVPVRIDVG